MTLSFPQTNTKSEVTLVHQYPHKYTPELLSKYISYQQSYNLCKEDIGIIVALSWPKLA